MNTPAILLATALVRPGHEAEFSAWQVRHNEVISRFPGFVSSDIMPPGTASSTEWTIVLNFKTQEDLLHWQQSPERARIVGESIPFLDGGDLGSVMPGVSKEQPETNVTEVILSLVKPGMEEQYREWAVRIQNAQAKYPGYRGMFLQPPSAAGGRWTTLLRYDTVDHLEDWLAAPERAVLLEESKAFIVHEELTRLATSFPGWVPVDPITGEGPPNWKTSLLVLLGLFPIVMLEMRYFSPILSALTLHASLATFIGNAVSVFATSFVTMPLFIRCFGWWLFPKEDTAAVSAQGCAILALLFAAEIAALWKLLPW